MSWQVDVCVFGTGYAAARVLERAAQCAGGGALGGGEGGSAHARSKARSGSLAAFEDGLTLGLAGRSLARMHELRAGTPGLAQLVQDKHLFVADVSDHASLVEMASKARCVINTVGPFMEHGEAVIRACLEAGANVVDLSGETEWIEAMQAKYGSRARERGSLVVSACGWDSVPSDALFWLLHSQLSEREKGDRYHVTLQTLMYMGQRRSAWGAFSGMGAGTLRTILDGWHSGRGIDFYADPAPVLAAARKLPSMGQGSRVEWFPAERLYGVRSELFSDAFVVRASQRAAARKGGANRFEYGHYFAAPNLPVAFLLATMLWLLPALLRVRLVYLALSRLVRPGAGPSRAQRANARASVHGLLCVYERASGKLVRTLRACADVEHDPNDVTAIVALRSALLIARCQSRLPVQAGCVTTATAFGERILEVLEPAATARLVGDSRPA
jgi:short subunit dehydrogenase-like uncharacterized protein